MRIEMRAQLSGTRDGVEWPAPGEVVDLPDDEAAQLIADGLAQPSLPAPPAGEVQEADAGADVQPSRRGRRKAED
jgi:hypothetical protein